MPHHARRSKGRGLVAAIAALALAAVAVLAILSAHRDGHGGASPGGKTTTSSLASRPGTTTSSTSSSSSTTTSTTSPMQAPMVQPTAQRPLTIVEVGDSLGEDLGFGLGDYEFASDPFVRIIQAAKGDTGLARPDYYDWPAELESLLHQYHPGAVIVFVGGNDAQNFYQGSQYASFGGATWHRLYAARVALMMSEALGAGARMVWVGMPIMQDPGFSAEMHVLDSIFRAEAARHPGVIYFSSWAVFSDAQGQYTASATIGGQEVLLRDPDGVHIANGGGDLLAQDLVGPMQNAWGIRLFPRASTSTSAPG